MADSIGAHHEPSKESRSLHADRQCGETKPDTTGITIGTG